ncbi:MAG: polyisoprenoid-binding protein [Chitinophagaceae bacterium]|nr:polyisoprenoid-binding protein [Rubrivivax sp.]
MKAFLACALWVVTAGAGAQPVTYSFDPEHSFVHFEVLHFGTSTSRGRFGPLSGQVVLDRTARRGEVSLRVATAAVDTGIAVFNARLRQPDLLASEAHPEAFFVASQVRFDGDKVAEVRGELTLRGVSQPLSLRALNFACRNDVRRQTEVCGGDFEGEVNRSEFGATFGLPLVADRVRLLVQVEGVRR